MRIYEHTCSYMLIYGAYMLHMCCICALIIKSLCGFSASPKSAGRGGEMIFFIILLRSKHPRYQKNTKRDFGNRPGGETRTKTLFSATLNPPTPRRVGIKSQPTKTSSPSWPSRLSIDVRKSNPTDTRRSLLSGTIPVRFFSPGRGARGAGCGPLCTQPAN